MVQDFRCAECGAAFHATTYRTWDPDGFDVNYKHREPDGNPQEYACSQVGKQFTVTPPLEER